MMRTATWSNLKEKRWKWAVYLNPMKTLDDDASENAAFNQCMVAETGCQCHQQHLYRFSVSLSQICQSMMRRIYVDEFVMRRGRWRSNFCINSSIRQYIWFFHVGNVLVFHAKISLNERSKIMKLKSAIKSSCLEGHCQKSAQYHLGNV